MNERPLVSKAAGGFWAKIESKFWAQVEVKGGNDCWIWHGYKFSGGKKAKSVRGYFYWAGRLWRAHRLAFVLAHGSIPANRFVCHRCDNPLCVNKNHLYLGTAKENVRDMVRKGRQHKRIPDKAVRQIRSLAKKGTISRKKIATKFGISYYHTGEIIRRNARKYLSKSQSGK